MCDLLHRVVVKIKCVRIYIVFKIASGMKKYIQRLAFVIRLLSSSYLANTLYLEKIDACTSRP